jgi:hypothetical protein
MINLELITEQVQRVIEYTQHIDNSDVSNLISNWFHSKQKIYNELLRRGELIYQYPEKLSFHMDEESKKDRYNCFIEEVVSLLNLSWSDSFVHYLESIGASAFYNNCLETNYTTIDGKRIQAGSKAIKSFKYFIKEKRALEELQNKASEIIQEDKIEGYLCFSIHPLDFLSSSENTYNWRSCHSLDGQYRAGNLSYMCDQSTMIVYLRAEEDVQLPHFPEGIK